MVRAGKEETTVLNWRVRQAILPWAFLSLPLAGYCLMVAYPIVRSVQISLTSWNGFSAAKQWVGISNYRALFGSPEFANALHNNATWVALFVLVPVATGFLLALRLERNTRLNIALRAVFYAPMAVSFAVLAVTWSWVYEPTQGLITQVLRLLHVAPPVQSLLTNERTAVFAIATVAIWQWLGFPMMVYISAIKAIPTELYEAAEIDGASYVQQVRYITIPQVRNSTIVIVCIAAIMALRIFDLVYMMTQGYAKTDVLSILMWRLSFEFFQVGKGAAVAVTQFLIVVCLVVPLLYYQFMARR